MHIMQICKICKICRLCNVWRLYKMWKNVNYADYAKYTKYDDQDNQTLVFSAFCFPPGDKSVYNFFSFACWSFAAFKAHLRRFRACLGSNLYQFTRPLTKRSQGWHKSTGPLTKRNWGHMNPQDPSQKEVRGDISPQGPLTKRSHGSHKSPKRSQGWHSKEIFPLLCDCHCISASRNLQLERPRNRFLFSTFFLLKAWYIW